MLSFPHRVDNNDPDQTAARVSHTAPLMHQQA